MSHLESDTSSVQSQSDLDRGRCIGHKYTTQEGPEVEWVGTSFLDLPAEVRNIIYDLSCEPISHKTQEIIWNFWNVKDGYCVTINSQGPIHLSSLSKLCRQVRKEYLSKLLSKHNIQLIGFEAARRWLDVFGDELAQAARAINLQCKLSIPFGSETQASDTGMQSCASAYSQSTGLCADYYIKGYDQTSLIFDLYCGPGIALRRSSSDAIRDLITQEPYSGDFFTFSCFLSLAERISTMALQVRAISAPLRPGLEVQVQSARFHVFLPKSWYYADWKEDKVSIYTDKVFRYTKSGFYLTKETYEA